MNREHLREEIARTLYESAPVVPAGRKKANWEDAHPVARTYRLEQADEILALDHVQELLADHARVWRVRGLADRWWRRSRYTRQLREALS